MKNCISRRSFLKAAGILGAAGALAACGGSSSTSTAASSTASSAAASAASTGASIKLWTYPIGGWGNDETVQNLISSFNAKYPDIKVTVEYLDYTNGDDQVNTAIEGGSAPDLVMEGPERLVANWGAKGVMAPLNDLWTDDAKKDIYASVESACKDDAGNYYEYPLCMTAHCMAVNMTKVKEVGANVTFEDFSLMNPVVLVGLFIGACLPFVFAALTMNSVGRAAQSVVLEVRRQFREITGLMEGKADPDYARCVDLCTKASLKEMVLPTVIAVVTPIVVGMILGFKGVVGLLAGATVTGFLMAIYMANAGGAWDNAKKYIEAGNLGGKGSDCHKAGVVGDTVGDPFKDTAGPAINILIKLLSMVSIVFAGLIVNYAIL